MVMMETMGTARSITVGTDFSDVPGGRYRQDGSHSGEEFRDHFLVPALEAGASVIVYLDGTAGYAGSFLEEAFGGLVRSRRFARDELRKRLTVKAHSERYAIYVRMVDDYLAKAFQNLASV